MRIAIIGSNGMLSAALTKGFFTKGHEVDVYGLQAPNGYECSSFKEVNLLTEKLDYSELIKNDAIIYAAGAGVQAALKTDSSLMYALNVNAPIELTLQLKKLGYLGAYISFGSYMEIGLNDEDGKVFVENDVICSKLPVTNDYALSKRLYGRYMNDFESDFKHWHFILPNMFSYNDIKPGTRLIPYILQYIQNYKSGNSLEEPSFSAGKQTRQFILLEDLICLLEKSMSLQIPSGVYNVGGGEFMSIKSLIKRIFAHYNVPCKEEYFGKEVRRDGDIKSLRISGDKLLEVLGYLPSTKIEEILPII